MGQITVLMLVAILSPLAGLIVGLRLLYATFTNKPKAWQIAIGWWMGSRI